MTTGSPFSHLFDNLIRDFTQPGIVEQAGVLIGALIVAWLIAHAVRRKLALRQRSQNAASSFNVKCLHHALFPFFGGVLVWFSGIILEELDDTISTSLLDLALVPLFGVTLIYLLFFIARRVFGHSGNAHKRLSTIEKFVLAIVWISMTLIVLGVHKNVLRWLDSVRINIAHVHMSLLSLVSGIFWAGVTVIVALWISTVFEERVMRSSSIDANLRVAFSRVGQVFLVSVAVLISLSFVGIDITVLGVFGGALGVGLGFGLQKIASNYVSGFIILLDRSLRIGDMINVDGYQGIVTEIRTRFTTVRGLDGIETLVPNEKLIGDVVQNYTSFVTRLFIRSPVHVSYQSDLEQVLVLLAQAGNGVERVAVDPPPAAYVAGFGPDGINLELAYWIEEMSLGTLSVRSEVNRNIWRLFAEHGIEIPLPQRQMRVRSSAVNETVEQRDDIYQE